MAHLICIEKHYEQITIIKLMIHKCYAGLKFLVIHCIEMHGYLFACMPNSLQLTHFKEYAIIFYILTSGTDLTEVFT